MSENNELNIVIITGMSGAGKTVALQSFEDMGYFCVDNLPPSLLPTFSELIKKSKDINRVCLVIDLRSREFFDEFVHALQLLDDNPQIHSQLVYLETSDAALVARYKESRRNHPLQKDGGTILEGIQREREELSPVRALSHLTIDTTSITPKELRAALNREFHVSDASGFIIEVMSFGFKYGIPIDADIVMDVRFLPNPHYIDELRPLTGEDESVYNYVMDQDDTEIFYHKFIDLLDFTLPLYEAEGKASLTIAIGCTGGQHRSVALARRIGQHIMDTTNYTTHISHRDQNKRKGTERNQ
ncbi:RNase adapter RapZ [Aerococcus loyolae]|uniref:RNase adapter RapZ n=1 Tax=Aerococcus urinae TaxID=1376 RepID=A0A2I1L642_9LACT|nr:MULTISPECIES: RNase adapter RapZ [Aerococcus]MDK6728457.1 RNase adapter RapZ [Aerococcus urinae]MDK7909387.1 RNase adapter RapZ [Aerococcus urinae]MDK8609688.1 RNase adapter RapZ [Aerococcus urinae]OFL15869.1 RNase adaptor protein RapZ [Aerococcus loyolae]PKY84871.1 RNase adapter RapZ [Aerococcus loyolae]